MTNPNIEKRLLLLTGLLKNNKFSTEQIKLVKKAYEFAKLKHGDQVRKSGEPYIIHPLETAIFLAEWKMDIPTIITGLLHDVLEDTDCTKEDMEKKFGKNIVEMVETVTKVSKISEENRNKETYDKENSEYIIRVIMSISSNLRPIIVKVADRMHNMETINHLKKEKQIRIANETFSIYANIAGRLGLYQQKTRLLDLSFSILDPEKYESTKEMIDKLLKQNRETLNILSGDIKKILSDKKINFEIIERIKGIYSTYKKLEKGIDINNIHDIFAVRIITDGDEIKCYEILGLIHINFIFLPNTFKDYISSPKLNLYQSIHTTITYRKAMLEVQIRNRKMDTIANFGVAAHWLYKMNDDQNTSEITNELMFDIFNTSDKEIGKKLKNIKLTKIYDVLLLNNNKWYVVNEGSTVLDLAFRYKPESLVHLKAVYKEGVPVSFDYNPIKDDVLTFEYNMNKITANPGWEEFATFEDAKKIFRGLDFSLQETSKMVKELKDELKDSLESAKEIKRRLNFLNFDTLESYLEFYKNFNNKKDVYGFLSKTRKWKKHYLELLKSRQKSALISYNIKDKNLSTYKKAIITECCTKLPGMQIVGILNKGYLFVHKFDCDKIPIKVKKYILEWDDDKIREFSTNYPASFYVNLSSHKIKINTIIRFITSKGFELLNMQSSNMDGNKTIMFQVLTNKLSNLKWLINELQYKFEGIESIKIK